MTEPGTTNGNKRGHLLLVALVLITLMSLFLAMAIRPLRTTSDRMKEQELLYRGTHLAEGIRRFYLTYGRFPIELEELVEREPRLVRQLYKDPMTADGDWTLVYLHPTDRTAVKGLETLAKGMLGQVPSDELNSENLAERSGPGLKKDPRSAFDLNENQITGIRSKSNLEGLTERDESRIYSDWLFSALPQKKADKEKLSQLINQIMQED